MIAIKEYLGALITGVNEARVLADQNATEIAQSYAADALLKNFPVPHFRVSTVELTVPVAIDKLEEVIPAEYQPFDQEIFNTKVVEILKKLTRFELEDERLLDSFQKTVAIQSELLEYGLKSGESKEKMLPRFSHSVVLQLLSLLTVENEGKLKQIAVLYEISRSQIPQKLESLLEEKLLPLIKEPGKVMDIHNTKVIVEAAKLKEIRPDTLVQIKMTLHEEGMEWHTMMDENGKVKSKLLPE